MRDLLLIAAASFIMVWDVAVNDMYLMRTLVHGMLIDHPVLHRLKSSEPRLGKGPARRTPVSCASHASDHTCVKYDVIETLPSDRT